MSNLLWPFCTDLLKKLLCYIIFILVRCIWLSQAILAAGFWSLDLNVLLLIYEIIFMLVVNLMVVFMYLAVLGTQCVISFLRQIVERGGFYRLADQTWVIVEHVQFVGACNPPTDPGRKPLSHRYCTAALCKYAHFICACIT